MQHTNPDGATCNFVLTVTVPAAQANGLRVEIVWDTATDMDSWMLATDASAWAEGNSLNYLNTNPFGFGDGGTSQPSLDVDDDTGFGPENMNIEAPVVGQTYAIAVHAYSGNANVVVRIFCGGVLQPSPDPAGLFSGQFWHAADVRFAADNSCTVVRRTEIYAESPTSTTYPR